MTFSSEQLNFFKFSTVVLDEFPVTLRRVFLFMWDNLVATAPGVPKWDDSVTVLNMFLAKEGGPKKVPTLNKSYREWDCTALFKATLFAQTFAMPDGTGGVSTLDKLYVKPRGLSAGTFHSSVRSATGNQAETYALALDQLRLLRNTLSHQMNTRKIDKATFDHYLSLAKDAFTALGQNTSRIDEIGKLAEEDFPIARLKQLKEELKRERDAAIKFKRIDDHLIKVESQVEGVRSEVKDVKTEVTDVKTHVEDVGSDVKDVKTEVTVMTIILLSLLFIYGVTDLKTRMEDVGSDVKDVKTEVTDVKTQVDDADSQVNELKAFSVPIKQVTQAESSVGPPFPYSGIPDKTPHFVGRQEECQAILGHLTNRDTRLVDVWGPPGFGKTSVAINVAHQLREIGIPVFFTSLHGMKSKDELVSKLLSIFADAKQVFYVSPSHWLIQCLQQLRNPFVLILDNADDLLESGDAKLKEDVLRFAEEILTQCSHIKLLFTTRESLDYLSHKLPIHKERVGVLDVASSVSLVQSLLPDVSDEDCSSIVKVCGQVPLAMRLMCSIMREENTSLNELLEELKILPLVEVLDAKRFPDNARLKTLINKSFERLTDHERAAFVSLVVFAGSFGIEEATAVLDLKTVRQTKNVIRSLERKSLIDCSEDFSTFTIHSLLRSFIDERRTTDQETEAMFLTAQQRFYSHHISRFEVANEKFLTGQSNEAFLAFLSHRDSMILSLVNGPRDEDLYPKAVEVLSKAELFLFAILPDEESLFKTIYDTAVKEAQKRQEVNDKGKLLAAKSFSLWGWFSSDHQTWNDSLLAGFTDSADCPAKLLCYFGIYKVLCGKLDEGISSLQSAVNSLSSRFDETILKQLVYQVLAISYWKKQEHKMVSYFLDLHRITANASLAYVGITPSLLKELSSSLKDNAFCFTVTTNLLLRLSKKKASTHGIFHAIGALYKLIYSGRIESSLEYINQVEADIPMGQLIANELKEQELIPTNVVIVVQSSLSRLNSTIHSLDRASITYFKQVIETALNCVESIFSAMGIKGREMVMIFSHTVPIFIQEVKKALWRYAKSYEDDLDVDCEALAKSYDIIGKLLYLTNDYSGAIESHQHAIRVREEKLGDHVDTPSSLTSIGCVHFEMSNEIEGVKSFQRAFELREQLSIYDHKDTASIYYTLGDKHFTLGNYEKAIEAHLQALELRKKHLGEHPLTGESFHQIAVVYYQKGIHSVTSYCNPLETCLHLVSYEKALTFCQQALVMRLKLLEEHTETAKSFHVLGCIQDKIGDKSSAVEAFQKASDMRSNLLGDHQDTAESYHWLGLAQSGMGDLKGALESLQKALQLRRKLSMGDNLGIADIIYNVGHVHFNMGDYRAASEQFQDAVDLYKRFLDKNERIADSCYNLAVTYLHLRSYPEALEYFQQSLRIRLELLGEHVDTANSFHALGNVHHSMGDFPPAVEAFQKASDMRSNLLGDHPRHGRKLPRSSCNAFYHGKLPRSS